jgi:hypothetical protein
MTEARAVYHKLAFDVALNGKIFGVKLEAAEMKQLQGFRLI